jgi:hypothetical protein
MMFIYFVLSHFEVGSKQQIGAQQFSYCANSFSNLLSLECEVFDLIHGGF